MKHTLLAKPYVICIVFMISIFITGGGCRKKCTDVLDSIIVMIPENELPEGWRMMPSSELPPNDKLSWWHTNPVLLNCDTFPEAIKANARNALYMSGTAYDNGHNVIVIFAFVYQTASKAQSDFSLLENNDNVLFGLSSSHANTIVLMGIERDVPDRQFFVQYFKSVTIAGPSCSQESPAGSKRDLQLPNNVSFGTESDLINFFQLWINLTVDKTFPPQFWCADFGEIMMKMANQGKFIGDWSSSDFEAFARALAQAQEFLSEISKDDWCYMGQDIAFGDSETAIFRYRPVGKDVYRIIYADLSVKDVALRENEMESGAIPGRPSN